MISCQLIHFSKTGGKVILLFNVAAPLQHSPGALRDPMCSLHHCQHREPPWPNLGSSTPEPFGPICNFCEFKHQSRNKNQWRCKPRVLQPCQGFLWPHARHEPLPFIWELGLGAKADLMLKSRALLKLCACLEAWNGLGWEGIFN